MKYKYNGQWVDLSIKALDSMEIGCIIQYMGNTIPNGWLECNGASISQSAYPELYNLIGGTLPDFRGRVLVGQDTTQTEFDTLGETGGSKYLQEHSHEFSVRVGNVGGWTTPLGGDGAGQYTGNTLSAGTGNSGNLQPYAVVKHIIKAVNTTPTMASIVNGYSTSTQDGYSTKYINEHFSGKVLWENSNTSQTVEAQDVQLSDNTYSKIKIRYLYQKESPTLYETALIEKGYSTSGIITYVYSGNFYVRSRYFTYNSDGTVTFGSGSLSGADNNNVCIPYQIIGYK